MPEPRKANTTAAYGLTFIKNFLKDDSPHYLHKLNQI